MYHILGAVALILAVFFAFRLEQYDSILGKILETAAVFPFIVIFLYVMLVVIYRGFLKLTGKADKSPAKEDKADYDSPPGALNDSDELFLEKHKCGDVIEYLVQTRHQAKVFAVKCQLVEGIVNSIELSAAKREPDIWAVRLTTTKYLIKEDKLVLGYLKIQQVGVSFYDVANRLINCAVLADEKDKEDECAAALGTVLAIATLTPLDKAKASTYLLKGSKNEVVGKYFGDLYNLELNSVDNAIDKRIAVLFAILLDTKIKQTKK